MTESTYEELLDSIIATLPSIDARDESTFELHHPEIFSEPMSKPLQRFAPAMSDSDVIKAHEQAIPKRIRGYCILH